MACRLAGSSDVCFLNDTKELQLGYLHINNLYRSQDILLFKRCFSLEKVHGTSTHVSYDATRHEKLHFFAGGCSHQSFVSIFDQQALLAAFERLGHERVVVFGEGYGGKMQGMSDTYGKELRFIAFDVKIGDNWLSVKDMDQVATGLGFEVVPYHEISTDLEELDRVRDMPSEVAVRRGCGNDKKREGVVLRPLIEVTKNNGERIIVKHKQEAFSERSTPQKVVDPAKLLVLQEANEIATEWTTEARLRNILSHMPPDTGIEKTGLIIKTMVEDIRREAAGEIVMTPDAEKAIGRRAAQLFKAHINQSFRNNTTGGDA